VASTALAGRSPRTSSNSVLYTHQHDGNCQSMNTQIHIIQHCHAKERKAHASNTFDDECEGIHSNIDIARESAAAEPVVSCLVSPWSQGGLAIVWANDAVGSLCQHPLPAAPAQAAPPSVPHAAVRATRLCSDVVPQPQLLELNRFSNARCPTAQRAACTTKKYNSTVLSCQTTPICPKCWKHRCLMHPQVWPVHLQLAARALVLLLLLRGCSKQGAQHIPKTRAGFCTCLYTHVASAHARATPVAPHTGGSESQLAEGTACAHAATAEAADRFTRGWPEQHRKAACRQRRQRVNMHLSSYCSYTSMLVGSPHCHVHLLSLQLPLQHPMLPVAVQLAPIAPLPIAQPAQTANRQ